MSFLTIIDGLNQTGSTGEEHALTGLEESVEYSCPVDDDPAGVSCFSCDTDTDVWSVNVAALPFDTAADYYVVQVQLRGPRLASGDTSCEVPLAGLSPCTGTCFAMYDGEVTSGPWLTWDDTPLDGEFTATVPEGGVTCQTNWPNISVPYAFLQNPSPVWPVPDSEGNTFGQCLFTEAQLLALPAVTLTLVHYNREQAAVGRFAVSIRAYAIGETEAPILDTCIVGYA